MILHKMQLDEATVLEFDLQVFGTAEKTSNIRFIIEGEEYSIMCKCTESDGNISVKIPKLKGVIPAGVYESRLEVVLDGKLFTPLSESVEFEPLIEFGVEKKKAEAIKEGVSVSLKNATPSFEDTNTNKLVEEAMAEGYDIVKIKGFDVLKKDGLYYGFVNENEILRSEVGYDLLNDLIVGLTK